MVKLSDASGNPSGDKSKRMADACEARVAQLAEEYSLRSAQQGRRIGDLQAQLERCRREIEENAHGGRVQTEQYAEALRTVELLRTRIARLEEVAAARSNEVVAARTAADEADGRERAVQMQLQAARAAAATEHAATENAARQVADIEAQLTEAQRELVAVRRDALQVATMRNELSAAAQARDECRAELEREKVRTAEMFADLERCQEELTNERTARAAREADDAAQRATFEQMAADLAEARNRIDALTAEIAANRTRHAQQLFAAIKSKGGDESLKKRIADLEAEHRADAEQAAADINGLTRKFEERMQDAERLAESARNDSAERLADCEKRALGHQQENERLLERLERVTAEAARLGENLAAAQRAVQQADELHVQAVTELQDHMQQMRAAAAAQAQAAPASVPADVGDCEERLRAAGIEIEDLNRRVEAQRDEMRRLNDIAQHVSTLTGRLDAATRRIEQLQSAPASPSAPEVTPLSPAAAAAEPSPAESPLAPVPEDITPEPSPPRRKKGKRVRVTFAPSPSAEPPAAVETAVSAEAAGADVTHAPHLGAEEGRASPRNADRIAGGSLKSMMLGTACDPARNPGPADDGVGGGVPEGCSRQPLKEGACAAPSDAVRGQCGLWTIPVPLNTPLGGNDRRYRLFRALDPGTQIKLHLHNARACWAQAVDIHLWASPVALDRNLKHFIRPSTPAVRAEEIDATALGGVFDSWDLVRGAIDDAALAGSAGTIAPEYARLIPEDQRESMPATRFRGKAGFFEPRPLWRDGNPDRRFQPQHFVVANHRNASSAAANLALRAVKHLQRALMIATYYAPGPEAIAAGAMGADEVPNGAMMFLADPELHAIRWYAMGFVDIVHRANADDAAMERMKDALHIEILRYLTESMRALSVSEWFAEVMRNTAARRGVVSAWLRQLRAVMPPPDDEEARRDPNFAHQVGEIVEDAGREAAVAAGTQTST